MKKRHLIKLYGIPSGDSIRLEHISGSTGERQVIVGTGTAAGAGLEINSGAWQYSQRNPARAATAG